MLSKIKITLAMLSSLAIASPALASDLSGADTAWLLTATALVLFMTLPGLSLFYGGLVRVRNVLSVLMQCFALAALMSLVWFVAGYTLAFGSGGVEQGPWLGDLGNLFLAGISLDGVNGSIPDSLFVMFQMTFAIITPALIVGGFAERMRFSAMLVFCVAWVLLVYAPICHWVWGGGWISELGALDFAGGTVVHVSAGVSAVAAALVLGRRKEDSDEPKPHNVPFVILGGSLLWFGWFGFNGGSALGANALAGLALLTTNLAAAAAMVCWTLLEWRSHGRPSAVGAMIGAVVGLVTITPAAGFVTPLGAIAMGALGSVTAFYAIKLLGRSRIDDSLDVFACHGVGGIVGSILTGFFATTAVNADGANGLFYGGGWSLVGIQTLTVVVAALFAGVVTVGLFWALKKLMGIRAQEVAEVSGLDLDIHGEHAYDYVMPTQPTLTGDSDRQTESA